MSNKNTVNIISSLFIKLNGSEDAKNIQFRINYLSLLQSNAIDNNNHIDKLRQNYLNFALLIFAGLTGFGISLSNRIERLFIYIPIPLIMLIFCLLDRKLHKLGHGWSHLRKIFTKKISEVINNPKDDTFFYRWYLESEKQAKLFRLQPIIYYSLISCGIILNFFSFFILKTKP